MRSAICVALLAAAGLLGGCTCNHPTSFFWMTRLVPTNGHEPVVSGTGATEYVPVAVAPAPDVK